MSCPVWVIWNVRGLSIQACSRWCEHSLGPVVVTWHAKCRYRRLSGYHRGTKAATLPPSIPAAQAVRFNGDAWLCEHGCKPWPPGISIFCILCCLQHQKLPGLDSCMTLALTAC